MLRKAHTVPTVLVTDATRGCAIAIIRSLGRRGWRVIAADSNPRSLGFRSCFTSEKVLYPPPETSPREFVAAMLEAAQDFSVDLIIPVTDAAILPLSQSRASFQGLCKLTLPDAAALEVVTNKSKTLELAARLGVPTPRTCLVDAAQEALERGPALGWPLVLKPQVSKLYHDHRAIESLGVCYAKDCDDLAEQMRRFEGRCPVLLQEYCSGVGQGVELLMHQGRPLAAFQHQRLREVPFTGGPSALRQSVPLDPTLYDHSVRLLAEVQWTGLAMVEFKGEGPSAKLMEINGRVWGSLPLAVHSGMDFPGRLADLWLFGPPPPDKPPETSYRVGVRGRNLELDLMWIATVLMGRRRFPFLAMPRRRQAVAALAQLFDPRCKFDILSLEDPAPSVAEFGKIVAKFFHKISHAG